MQNNFADPIPDELRKDACIMVTIDRFSKYPITKVVTNTTTDTAKKLMQRYIMRNGVQRRINCDEAQTLGANKNPNLLQIQKQKTLFRISRQS